jgi:phage FluMu gp28-like protein
MTAPQPTYVLLPYQARWYADESRVKLAEKSRRTGFTWTSACKAVDRGATGKMDSWYIGYNEDLGLEFIRDAGDWLKHWQSYLNSKGVSAGKAYETTIVDIDPETGESKSIKAFRIDLSNGCRITALTSRPRNLRGKQGCVIIDEAAFHDDLPGLMKAAIALLMWGGCVEIISTHDGVDNEFAKLVNSVRDGKLKYSLHRVSLDDALAEGLYKRICLVTGVEWSAAAEVAWRQELIDFYGDGANEELFCEPAKSGASYIARALIESRMFDAPVVRLERKDDWALEPEPARTAEIATWCEAALGPLLAALPDMPHFFGWDFGRVADRSVLAPVTLQQNLVRRVPFLLEMANVPHNHQWQVLRYVGERLPRLYRACMDAGGNGSWIAEQAAEHWGDADLLPGTGVVERIALSVGWYAENMPPFKEAHESATILYPRDIDVRNDVSLIRRVDGVPRIPKEKTDSSQKSAKKRHGDAAVALVLGYAASRSGEADARRWDNLTKM